MDINHTVETPEGEVVFQGTLNPVEVKFLLTYAINGLMAKGAVPFVGTKESNFYVKGSSDVQ